jgi:AcrR family transcriptional regulator
MSGIQEKNTKDRILDAAFSFYTEPCFVNVSLREIALRAGITKSAIFRHFSSKKELLDSMNLRYFDDIYAILPESEVPFPVLLKKIAGIMYAHKEYLFYTLYQYIADTGFEARMYIELEKRGINLQSYGICSGVSEDKTHIIVRNQQKYYKLLYEIATTVFFLSSRDCSACNANICSDSEYALFLNKMLECGISSSSHFVSDKRMQEINLKCSIRPEDMPPVNPLFNALSEVIRKKGFPGTTVESIADELGLAKSSLYTYFRNKDELIITLVEKELLYFVRIVIQKVDKADSEDERGYIIMRTMIEYYLMRPSVVSVTAWLRIRGSFMFDSVMDKIKIDTSEFTKVKETVTGFPMTNQLYYGWLHVLVTTIFCQSHINGLSLDDCNNAISTYFKYIQQGVYNDEEL